MAIAEATAAPIDIERSVSPWLIAPVVALASFMEVLDISIANVALNHIAGALGASLDESTWVLTSYTVTNVMILPVSAWLSTVLGRRNYFQLSIIGFSLTSLLCGIAPTLGLLVLFRALQGLTGGGLQPVSQAILMDAFPPAMRGVAMAVFGLAVVFAPAIGPTLGGWLTDNFDWRWVFLINVPVGFLVSLLVQAFVKDPEYLVRERAQRRRVGIKLDGIGLSLLVVGVGFLQVVLDRGQDDDWFGSNAIVIMSATSAIAIVSFIIWEWNSDHPIVDLRLLRYRNFAIGCLQLFVLGVVVLSSVTLMPLFVQELLGYPAMQAGYVMTAGGCVMIVTMPFTGWLLSRYDGRWMMAIGFLVCGISTLKLTTLDLTASFAVLAWCWVFAQSSLAFIFIPINVMAYTGVPADKTGDISGLLNMFRNLGASVGISMATTELSRRAQYHQEILSAQTSPLNSAYRSMLQGASHAVASISNGAVETVARANAFIYQEILQQANLMAFLDDFQVIGYCALALVPLAFLMERGPTAKGPVSMH